MNPEDFSPEVREAGEALLRAWRDRSPHELDAFEKSLAEGGAQASASELTTAHDIAVDERQLADAVSAAERIAAVSGELDPAQLTAATAPKPLASLVIDRLAPSFDRAWKDGRWAWTLKSERRATVLRGASQAQLAQTLALAAGVKTDEAGEELRRLLAEGPRPAAGVTGARAQASQWAAPASDDLANAARAVRTEVARGAALRGLDHLVQNGFFGREREVSQLQSFARVQAARTGPMDLAILQVSGIGGSGKSTLLARSLRPLVTEAMGESTAPLLVGIDFDRRCLLAGAELELSFELSRQLALYYPQAADELASLRERFSRARAWRGELSRSKDDSAGESLSRHSEEFDYEAASELRRVGAQSRRLVIVLDTFEEWQRESHGAWQRDAGLSRLLGWLNMLQRTWGFQLRVIVSGRAPLLFGAGTRRSDYPAIRLGPLKRGEAVQLLEHMQVPPSAARRLARIAGGMPLSLKLAARYYLRLPEAERSGFLRDTQRQLSRVSDELRQGVLYRRFLEHIQDEQARRLAHPGLALRRVSVQLIREVLAQPCGLGPITPQDAQRLFDLLAREVWLVEEQGEWLIHRPELRTVMLDAMRGDPVQAERIRQVHRAAAQWYEWARDPEGQAEHIYHRLMLAGADEFEEITADADAAALLAVEPSAADLPEAIRVRLLARLGRRLTLRDAEQLPPDVRSAWAEKQAQECVAAGAPARSLDIWDRLGDGRPPGSWYYTAAFQARRWEATDALEAVELGQGSLRYGYLMSFVLERTAPEAADRLREKLHEQIARRVQLTTSEVRMVMLEDAYFASVVTRGAYRTTVSADAIGKWVGESQLDATRYLRLLTILRDAHRFVGERASQSLLASAFRPTPQFMASMLSRLDALQVEPTETRTFMNRLAESIEEGLRGSQVLGQWSDWFALSVARDVQRAEVPRDRELASLLDALSADDPEWRVAIRDTLAQDRSERFAAEAARHVGEALGEWVPRDLRMEELREDLVRNPARAWKRAVEYLDRCAALPRFMQAVQRFAGPPLLETTRAYLAWQERRRVFESMPRG